MLPQLPAAFHPEFAAEFSQSDTTVCSGVNDSVEHHCQICPTCGYRLTGYRCKLVCGHCGYYLSCADFY